MTNTDGSSALAPYEAPRLALIPNEQTTNSAFSLAKLAAASGLCKTKKPEDAFFVIMHGYEIGIPAMTALRTIHIINGVPVTSGEALLAIIRRSQKVDVKITGSATEATVWMKRRDSGEEYTAHWTLARATTAGLTGKQTWKNFPQQFLQWRCVGECSKFLCSDITNGLYPAEEIAPDLNYDEGGNIIEGQTITVSKPAWHDDERNLHELSERAFTSGFTKERNGKGIGEIKDLIAPKVWADFETGRDCWLAIKEIVEARRAQQQPAPAVVTPAADVTPQEAPQSEETSGTPPTLNDDYLPHVSQVPNAGGTVTTNKVEYNGKEVCVRLPNNRVVSCGGLIAFGAWLDKSVVDFAVLNDVPNWKGDPQKIKEYTLSSDITVQWEMVNNAYVLVDIKVVSEPVPMGGVML